MKRLLIQSTKQPRQGRDMDSSDQAGPLVARCIVCKGNIHERDPHEVWEGGFYCRRHSLPALRARAREYAALLESKTPLVERH